MTSNESPKTTESAGLAHYRSLVTELNHEAYYRVIAMPESVLQRHLNDVVSSRTQLAMSGDGTLLRHAGAGEMRPFDPLHCAEDLFFMMDMCKIMKGYEPYDFLGDHYSVHLANNPVKCIKDTEHTMVGVHPTYLAACRAAVLGLHPALNQHFEQPQMKEADKTQNPSVNDDPDVMTEAQILAKELQTEAYIIQSNRVESLNAEQLAQRVVELCTIPSMSAFVDLTDRRVSISDAGPVFHADGKPDSPFQPLYDAEHLLYVMERFMVEKDYEDYACMGEHYHCTYAKNHIHTWSHDDEPIDDSKYVEEGRPSIHPCYAAICRAAVLGVHPEFQIEQPQ